MRCFSLRDRQRSRRSLWFRVLFVSALAFVVAYGAAFAWLATQTTRSLVPFSDYCIELPEGETVVTVSDPRRSAQPLAQLVIHRRGAQITGAPRRVVRLPPRVALAADDAAFFREEMRGLFHAQAPAWDKANAIRAWLARRTVRLAVPGLQTRRAREAYLQMIAGAPVLCANLADIYVAACEAVGLTARTVGMSLLVRNGNFGRDTHVGAEVWIPELGGWIYQDPTFDCYWEIDHKPASALEIHEALLAGRAIVPGPRGRGMNEVMRRTAIDPRLYFRHLYYEYRIGGAALYFADPRLEPVRIADANWVQTDDPEALRRLDTDGNTVVDQRGEIAPGIFAQVIRGQLFIRDRRAGARGIRVRSSRGPVRACAYEHRRAEELGVFASRNHARNGLFHRLGENGALAEDWSISGPVEGMAALGGQGFAGRAGARLWQRIRVEPNRSYLLYAKVNVPANRAQWVFGDASVPRSFTHGECEPERISEIISDVVTSETGELEIAFELPEGGAMRVLEVIVVELPPSGVGETPERQAEQAEAATSVRSSAVEKIADSTKRTFSAR